jgi:hypothetical protein
LLLLSSFIATKEMDEEAGEVQVVEEMHGKLN